MKNQESPARQEDALRPLGEERTINRNGLLVIYRKEMADHIHSRRFFIVLCLDLDHQLRQYLRIRIHADRGTRYPACRRTICFCSFSP